MMKLRLRGVYGFWTQCSRSINTKAQPQPQVGWQASKKAMQASMKAIPKNPGYTTYKEESKDLARDLDKVYTTSLPGGHGQK